MVFKHPSTNGLRRKVKVVPGKNLKQQMNKHTASYTSTVLKSLVFLHFLEEPHLQHVLTLLTKEELNLLWRKTVSSSVSEMAPATCLLVTTPKRTTPRKSAP